VKFRFSRRTLVKVTVFTLVSAVLTVALAMRIANVNFSDLFADQYTIR
jgi:hypothetical protein